MTPAESTNPEAMPRFAASRGLRLAIAVGLVISLGGYESRVVDQCYRLPIVARMIDSTLYPNDAFVRAFDAFNPHLGYAKLLIAGTRLIGISLTLFLLFAATLAVTLDSLWRIRARLWPSLPEWADWLLVAAFALCRTGNIGTNHLWEDHLLDRQIGYALLWLSLAEWLAGGRRRLLSTPFCVGLTAIVHPGLGLLTAALWAGVGAASWIFGDAKRGDAAAFLACLALAMIPWAVTYAPQSHLLKADVDSESFWRLATELQGPQHMRPVHWRASQWWAAAALAASGLTVAGLYRREADRTTAKRCAIWSGLIVVGLSMAVPLIEFLNDINVAVAQPFRLATPLRGLCLIALLPHWVRLIRTGGFIGAARAVALLLALRGDRAFTLAAIVESATIVAELIAGRYGSAKIRRYMPIGVFGLAAFCAMFWLSRHDTADGEILLAAGYATGAGLAVVANRANVSKRFEWSSATTIHARRLAAFAWAGPIAAIIIGSFDPGGSTLAPRLLASKWRVYETPRTDMERLGLRARQVLPIDALVLAPPRDKGFRHWSRRSVVVNVAGSPYQASALKEWAERLRVVAGEPRDANDFAKDWPKNRVAWETHYEKASSETIAGWGERFGATAIVINHRDRGIDVELESKGWQPIAQAGSARLFARQTDRIALGNR